MTRSMKGTNKKLNSLLECLRRPRTTQKSGKDTMATRKRASLAARSNPPNPTAPFPGRFTIEAPLQPSSGHEVTQALISV